MRLPAVCWVFTALTAAAIPLPSALAQESVTAEQRGQQLVEQHCAMCHATARSGSSPHRQAPPFRTLARRYPLENLEEALAEGIVSGHPDMPEFTFPPYDVGAIIRYLEMIQER